MDFLAFLTRGLDLTGTFNPAIAILLFLICFIGEVIGLSIPYLMETTWLLAGYQLAKGVLPPFHLLLLLLMAQGGRELGVLVLYSLSRLGAGPLLKFVNRFTANTAMRNGSAAKAFRKINLLSPFSVAAGRLLWLRVPLTLILSVQKKLRILVTAVFLSTLVWDCAYVIIGAIVGRTFELEQPGYMVLIFLAGLTVLYVVTFVTRRVYKSIFRKRNGKAGGDGSCDEAGADDEKELVLSSQSTGNNKQCRDWRSRDEGS